MANVQFVSAGARLWVHNIPTYRQQAAAKFAEMVQKEREKEMEKALIDQGESYSMDPATDPNHVTANLERLEDIFLEEGLLEMREIYFQASDRKRVLLVVMACAPHAYYRDSPDPMVSKVIWRVICSQVYVAKVIVT